MVLSRLADVLPVPEAVKQTWLELDSTTDRLTKQLGFIRMRLRRRRRS